MTSPSWRYSERPDGGEPKVARWWKANTTNLPQAITATLSGLDRYQNLRLAQWRISERLHGGLQGGPGIFGTRARQSTMPPLPVVHERSAMNLVQACISTLCSRIGKMHPRIVALTSGGNFEQQRAAQKLTKALTGVFEEGKLYSIAADVFRDALVYGTGGIKVLASPTGRVRFERVLISEIFVDDVEAYYGEPKSLHHVRAVSREILFELFGKKECIKNAPEATQYYNGSDPGTSDVVLLRESFKIPSAEGATDGRHVLSLEVEGGVLLDEPYERQTWPIAFFHWDKRLHGFYGQGLAEQLMATQVNVNKLLHFIDQSFAAGGSFKVMIPVGSKIVQEQLNGAVGSLVYYNGPTPPQYVVPPLVQPEIYQHLERLRQSAFTLAGLTEAAVAAQKPAGLTSGEAIRNWNDLQSERYIYTSQAFERFFVELGYLATDCIEDITEGKKSYVVKVPGRQAFEEIDFSEVNLARDNFILQHYPTSLLPTQPAGRLSTVSDLLAAGLITQQDAGRLLEFPDLERTQTLHRSAEDYLTKILDEIVDDGRFTPPEPFDNLDLAQKFALERYEQGKTMGLPEERLELLRRFMSQVQALKQAAMPPPMPAPMPGAPPPAPAAAPPPLAPPAMGGM